MVKKYSSHVGETVGIYKIIGVSDKKNKGKTLHIVQCTECGRIFEKMYNNISGSRVVKVCRHDNKTYIKQDIFCKNCGKKIEKKGMSLSEYSRKKFCSQSCAASYNNRGVTHNPQKPNAECLNCHNPIPHKNKFCSTNCQQNYYYNEYIKKWKNGLVNGTKGKEWIDVSDYVKRYLFEKYNNQCAKCGWSEINPYTGTLPLEIEHIDGDATNNTEENLILLCPNCHSLTKTYRGANRGNGTRNIKWLSRSGIEV